MHTIGRFAPSPSGRMHLGNVLCALLAWLSARQQNGEFLLRIEDLDEMRCPQEGGIVGFRHPQHGFCAIVRKFIRRIRKAAYRSFDRLDQQAVIINSADDFAVVVEYVLPHHGSMRYAVQPRQAV